MFRSPPLSWAHAVLTGKGVGDAECPQYAGRPVEIMVNRNTFKSWATLSALAGSAFVAACSGEGGQGSGEVSGPPQLEQPAEAQAGELLARVDITKTHYVEFRGLVDGKAGLGIIEYGQQGEPPLDRSDWDALGAEAVYARLAKVPAPSALVRAAEINRAKQSEPVKVKSDEFELPTLKRDSKSIHITRNAAESPNIDLIQKPQTTIPLSDGTGIDSVDGLGKSTQGVYGDNAWFTQNFCAPTTDIEASTIWCMPGYGSVQGGTRYTMYYSAAGMAAPASQGANFYVEWYDWSASVWRSQYSVRLTPGQYVTYTWNGEVTFRSSIYGVNNSAVHFVDKQRRQISYLNHYTDYPSDVGWDFGNDIQGLTHDASNWFMTRSDYGLDSKSDYGQLTKIPVSRDLYSEPTNVVSEPTAWRGQYNHYGALARRSSYLYVPMDGPGGCAVGVFSTSTLAAVGKQVLSTAGKCGWIAYNPFDGLFYAPIEGQGNNKVFKYSISVSGSTVSVTPKGVLTLSSGIAHAAGADFSARGTMWVVAGLGSQPLYLYAVDSQNGFVYFRQSFSRGGGPNEDFEAEGVTLWDLSGGQAPGIRGHVHLQILRNDDLSDDQLWINHLVATDPSAL